MYSFCALLVVNPLYEFPSLWLSTFSMDHFAASVYQHYIASVVVKCVKKHFGQYNFVSDQTETYAEHSVCTHFHSILKIQHQTLNQISNDCCSSAALSKNTLSANIKHSRYFHLTSNFWSIHFHAKRLYVHIFDMVDTFFSYWRASIVC